MTRILRMTFATRTVSGQRRNVEHVDETLEPGRVALQLHTAARDGLGRADFAGHQPLEQWPGVNDQVRVGQRSCAGLERAVVDTRVHYDRADVQLVVFAQLVGGSRLEG